MGGTLWPAAVLAGIADTTSAAALPAEYSPEEQLEQLGWLGLINVPGVGLATALVIKRAYPELSIWKGVEPLKEAVAARHAVTSEVPGGTGPTISTWGVLEKLGRQKTAGRISEELHMGTVLGRIDIPTEDGGFTTQWFSGASVYAITPTSEEVARSVAAHNQPEPVHVWELPQPQLTSPLSSDTRYGLGLDEMDDEDARHDTDGDDKDDDSELTTAERLYGPELEPGNLPDSDEKGWGRAMIRVLKLTLPNGMPVGEAGALEACLNDLQAQLQAEHVGCFIRLVNVVGGPVIPPVAPVPSSAFGATGQRFVEAGGIRAAMTANFAAAIMLYAVFDVEGVGTEPLTGRHR